MKARLKTGGEITYDTVQKIPLTVGSGSELRVETHYLFSKRRFGMIASCPEGVIATLNEDDEPVYPKNPAGVQLPN